MVILVDNYAFELKRVTGVKNVKEIKIIGSL